MCGQGWNKARSGGRDQREDRAAAPRPAETESSVSGILGGIFSKIQGGYSPDSDTDSEDEENN
jgi:hypothetical protein